MFEPEVVLIHVATVVLLILVCFKTTRKLVCGVVAAALIVVAACAIQDTARAEETVLPDEFYYRIAFVDAIEGDVVHADDLHGIWDYYEDYNDVEFANDKALEEFAKSFIKVNSLWSINKTTNPVAKGRIIVLTMWEANPANAVDDEIVDVYYSKFITDVR